MRFSLLPNNPRDLYRAIVFSLALLFGLALAAKADAQVNTQCVAVAITQAINHQCPPDVSPLRCVVRKIGFGAASYFQCANPATTLRNFRRNQNASLRYYRTPQAAARFQPVRVFQNRPQYRVIGNHMMAQPARY